MADFNSLKYISQQAIKDEIHQYVDKELNSNDIIKELTPATINIIENVAAGAASFMIYNSMMMKNERFLSTAVLDDSVFNLAHDYSYNISRAVAPKVNLIYNSTDTLFIKANSVLGKYNDLDVIYFGDNATIEKGDIITAIIGKVFEFDDMVKMVDSSYSVTLNPSELLSVDNDLVRVWINEKPREISKLVEDFSVWNKIVDFSTSNRATKLNIADTKFKYGINLYDNDSIKVAYIETNGYEAIDLTKVDVPQLWLVDSIASLGVAPEDVDKIRELAPLFYTTQRRMVSEKDHIFIAQSSPYFKSIGYKKDGGQPFKAKFRLESADKPNYTIYIDQIPISYVKKAGDTELDILQGLVRLLRLNPNVSVTLEGGIIAVAKDSRNDTQVVAGQGLQMELIQENIKAPCCTVFLYYVKHNVVDTPILLTDREEDEVAEYLEDKKLSGVRVILLPASRIDAQLKLKVRLTDGNKFGTQVIEAIYRIVREYELRVDTKFLYGDFLAEVAKIKVMDLDSKTLHTVIDYILPDQDVFDIDTGPDNYIKFSDVAINFI